MTHGAAVVMETGNPTGTMSYPRVSCGELRRGMSPGLRLQSERSYPRVSCGGSRAIFLVTPYPVDNTGYPRVTYGG